MITMTYKELEIEYLVSYDGKNGTPQMEFLQLEGVADTHYDEETDTFKRQLVYQTTGNISVH